MKLHTDRLTSTDIFTAMREAKAAGDVSPDAYFYKFDTVGSRSKAHAFEIQLGADDQTSGPTKSRRYKNSGQYGANRVWAATYEEWGWFISRLFAADPDATFGPYKGEDDFHSTTRYAFVR